MPKRTESTEMQNLILGIFAFLFICSRTMGQDWHNIKYDAAHFVLAFLYAVMFLLSVACWALFYFSSHLRLNWQKIFHPFLMAGTLSRMGFFLLQPFIMEGNLELPNRVNNILDSLPSFFFFTDYLIILFLWAEVYHFREGLQLKRLGVVFALVNVAMYMGLVLLYTLDVTISKRVYTAASEDISTIEKVIQGYLATIYLSTSLGYLSYGLMIYLKLSASQTTPKGRWAVRKIQLLASIISVCFLIRAILVVLDIFQVDLSVHWWLDLVYYASLECLPLLLMIVILHATREPKRPEHHAALINEKQHGTLYAT